MARLLTAGRRSLALATMLAAAATILVVLRTAPTASPVELSGRTMGTSYRIVYRPEAATAAPASVQAGIERLLAEINASMSTWDPGSELSRINRVRTTGWIAVSPELHQVLRAALDIGARSGGAFDVTISPLVALWGFGPGSQPRRIPTTADLADAHRHVGLGKLELRDAPPALRKTDPEVQLDLSAIAKGYAVDRVSQLLDAHGIDHHLVEIGGEVRARGGKAAGERWRVGIERPMATGRRSALALGLEDVALATSGDYRNFFTVDGRRYAHLIDPATGRPVRHHALSASVVAATCMEADAWATALHVLGPERGLAVAERQGVAVLYLIGRDARLEQRASRRFQRYLQKQLH